MCWGLIPQWNPPTRAVMRILEEPPREVRFAVAEQSWVESRCPSPNTVLPFVAQRQWAAAGEEDRQPEPDTGSS